MDFYSVDAYSIVWVWSKNCDIIVKNRKGLLSNSSVDSYGGYPALL